MSEGAIFFGVGTIDQYTAAPDLAIGETIIYQMTIVVPEGTSNILRLVDTLPSIGAGDPGTLDHISSRVVSIGANISNSALDEMVVTDTIALRPEARACTRIRQLSVAELLAETIRRIAGGESVSSLYVD